MPSARAGSSLGSGSSRGGAGSARAAARSSAPAPVPVSGPVGGTSRALSSSTWRTWAGVSLGRAAITRAAAPDTTAAAIEVPVRGTSAGEPPGAVDRTASPGRRQGDLGPARRHVERPARGAQRAHVQHLAVGPGVVRGGAAAGVARGGHHQGAAPGGGVDGVLLGLREAAPAERDVDDARARARRRRRAPARAPRPWCRPGRRPRSPGGCAPTRRRRRRPRSP